MALRALRFFLDASHPESGLTLDRTNNTLGSAGQTRIASIAATSTRATSHRPRDGSRTSRRLLRRKPMLAGTRPLASRPPARPALVAYQAAPQIQVQAPAGPAMARRLRSSRRAKRNIRQQPES